MARPLRIEFPGAVYNVTSRGNAREPIYLNDRDRSVFLAVLAETVKRYGWICHAYSLMDDHYHLLVETPEPNLSLGMRHLNGVYTQAFNGRYKRVGHLFQGRFRSILVEKDSHLLELSRYAALNPVRVGVVKGPGDWPWSSYRATAGMGKAPAFLSVDWMLHQFGKTKKEAWKRYVDFVHEGLSAESPMKEVTGQIIYGGESFVAKIQKLLAKRTLGEEIPRRERRVPAIPCVPLS